MRRALILAACVLMAAPMAPAVTVMTTHEVGLGPTKRRKSKTNNKIQVFMGYASDRKGKGQRAKEARSFCSSKNGWR